MKKVKVIGKITLNNEQINQLKSLGVTDIAFDNPKSRNDEQEIIRRIGDADAIVINISVNITANIIKNCPALRFIQTWSTGTDNIDLDTAKEKNIIVKNVPDFSTEAVAEKTLGLMISLANDLFAAHLDAKAGNWNYTRFQGVELKDKTLCIIGKGKIGHRVQELANAFGMKTLLVDSKTTKQDLHTILSQSDFVTLHCPYAESTRHLLSTSEFNVMKKGVYLINNSRGGVVDEVALLQALNGGIVKFASMDVFENEPPSKDNLLLVHSKVFTTPHCAWNTKEAVRRLSDVCINNLAHYLSEK